MIRYWIELMTPLLSYAIDNRVMLVLSGNIQFMDDPALHH